MIAALAEMLRCPITKSKLTLQPLRSAEKELDGKTVVVIMDGILYADNIWFYPVINGIPVLLAEAVIDHEDFLELHMPDFAERKKDLFAANESVIREASKKNKRTKESFTQEWLLFRPDTDKTWNADAQEMTERFFKETGETAASLQHKIVFDAGCGNGLLNILLANAGITNIAMDFSNSIEHAYQKNRSSKVHFIRGDVQAPPVAENYFDLVHCSGVLIHTNNTARSFSCIDPLVKAGGKMSVWLYHPREDLLHNIFNNIRKFTSKLPLKFQYWLYVFTIFPLSWIVKKIKGNPQNSREMMIDILDWFTPEFRWEHTHEEVHGWFLKKNYTDVQVTTTEVFGFNTTGIKKVISSMSHKFFSIHVPQCSHDQDRT